MPVHSRLGRKGLVPIRASFAHGLVRLRQALKALKGRLGPIAETVKESAARSHPKCTARRPRLD